MLVWSRPRGTSGALAALMVGLTTIGTGATPAQEPPAPAPEAEGAQKPRLEDLPAPFVPKTPRTAEEQERIEGLRDYVAGRALEDRRQLREALVLLEKARQKLPNEVGVLRRLSRISFALGRLDQGIAYARQAVEADPTDADTLRPLISSHRELKSHPAA